MRQPLLFACLGAVLLAGAAQADRAAWEGVWKSEAADRQLAFTGSARTTALIGEEQRGALARVAGSSGKVRFDYEAGRLRWSLVDDGQHLIWLDLRRRDALVSPRPTFAEDRRLAERNYDARVVGRATVAGRACDIVEVAPRGRGQRVWRLWLDRETSFALKRERYNVEGELTSGTEYLEVAFGVEASPESFRVPPGWMVVDTDGSGVRLEVSELERRVGFPVAPPRYVPSDYVFLGGYVQRRGRWEPEMAELRYTDGLRVLSVFQRPREDERRGRGREGRGRHGFGRGRGREDDRGGHGGRGFGRGRDRHGADAPERGRAPRAEGERDGRGRGRGRGLGPPGSEEMTLVARGSEKAFRYLGRERTVIVVGDLPAEELMRVARSVE